MEVRDESGKVLGDSSSYTYDTAAQTLDFTVETVRHAEVPYIAPVCHIEGTGEIDESGFGELIKVVEDEPGQEYVPAWSETVCYYLLRDATGSEKAEADRQETLSLLPDAIADLSETVSTTETTSTELADAIAELSAIVSELAAVSAQSDTGNE